MFMTISNFLGPSWPLAGRPKCYTLSYTLTYIAAKNVDLTRSTATFYALLPNE